MSFKIRVFTDHGQPDLFYFEDILTAVFLFVVIDICMQTRIAQRPLRCAPEYVPYAPPSFLIASMDIKLVCRYPQIFEFGRAEYHFDVDSFICHDEVAEGESTAVGISELF